MIPSTPFKQRNTNTAFILESESPLNFLLVSLCVKGRTIHDSHVPHLYMKTSQESQQTFQQILYTNCNALSDLENPYR